MYKTPAAVFHEHSETSQAYHIMVCRRACGLGVMIE